MPDGGCAPRVSSCVRVLGALILMRVVAGCGAGAVPGHVSSGYVEFADGDTLEFGEVVSLVFTHTPRSNDAAPLVDEWLLEYAPAGPARSIPLAWVASLVITHYGIQPGCECVVDAVIQIESVSGVVISSRFHTLERLEVTVGAGGQKRVLPFAREDRLHIHRIVFNRARGRVRPP